MNKAQITYVLGEIALASEIPLPELPRLDAGSAPLDCVNIRVGDVPFVLPDGVEVDPDCLATSSEYLLRIEGVARYRVSRGREIVVQLDENAPALNVRAYLLGTIFAVLCHQRGLLPLHAGAVRFPGGVAAFPARSGQGKSSFVAHLAKRGFPVVADDICLVDTSRQGVATVIPAAPWLKLWRSALKDLGRPAEGLDQVFSEDDKYRLPVEPAPPQPALRQQSMERQPIRRLIFLEQSAAPAQLEIQEIEIREIPRLRALNLLMNLTHQAYLLEAIGKREENFLRCGRVLSQARAYRLIRPWGFEHMERALDRMESFLRQDEGQDEKS